MESQGRKETPGAKGRRSATPCSWSPPSSPTIWSCASRLRATRSSRAIRAAGNRYGLKILQYAILDGHLHFVVQAYDKVALSRGMQGLLIRIARALNRTWGTTGKVFGERFHSAVLKHYWALRRAVRYVLQNARKHGLRLPVDRPDPYTSGPWFRGWERRNGQPFDTSEPPVSMMEWTGMYLEGFRRITIGLAELPGPSPWGELNEYYM